VIVDALAGPHLAQVVHDEGQDPIKIFGSCPAKSSVLKYSLT
jgi:hypothetical protein